MATRRAVIMLVLSGFVLSGFACAAESLKVFGLLMVMLVGVLSAIGVPYFLSGVIDKGITMLEDRWQRLGREVARRDNAEK